MNLYTTSVRDEFSTLSGDLVEMTTKYNSLKTSTDQVEDNVKVNIAASYTILVIMITIHHGCDGNLHHVWTLETTEFGKILKICRPLGKQADK